MKKIKFSHWYDKFPDNINHTVSVILMEVFRINSKDLHKRFIEYDTSYYDKKNNECGYYKLPNEYVLVLLFRTHFDELFTTIRRSTPEKDKYYMNARGEEFKVVITEAKQ